MYCSSHPGDSTFLLDDKVLSAISGMQYPPQTPPENDQAQFQLHTDLPTTPQAKKLT